MLKSQKNIEEKGFIANLAKGKKKIDSIRS